MSWFKHGNEVTHLCGGVTEKEKNNKTKETQTEMTLWFQPVEVIESGYKCKACGEVSDMQTDITEIS